jgi:hypothetical protein
MVVAMNTYTITRQQLVALGACTPGLRAFDEEYPDGVAVIEWTHEVQVALATGPLKHSAFGVRKAGLLPRYDLTGANLRGADLRGADLRDADLRGANLTGAKLWRANLRGANLEGANLEGADLWDADMWGANLTDANLRGANLAYANLKDADLLGAAMPTNWRELVAFAP